ncbi:MAG: carboxypeptidase-like regulatory domain-containing protein [Bacteroidales bacterium]|jgi:hypothetical protein|nr:carboxypeptidase-like regulatory domain-containing protein [Bacteroidales bacterium]
MKINSLIVILIALSFFACNKDEEEKKETTSSISGKVTLYDEGKTSIDSSDMTVTIEGTSPLLTAQTDADGNFVIENVPFGTYNLLFEKTGYGAYRYFNATLTETGGPLNLSETFNLGQQSDLTITDFIVHISHGSIDYTGTVDPEGTADAPKYIRIFYSTDSTVSSSNYTYYSEAYEITANTFELPITKEELIDGGFASGTTVYMKVHGDAYWNNSYEDPTSGDMVFPNLSADSPETVSFVIP